MDAPGAWGCVFEGADAIWQASTEPEIIERLAQASTALGWTSVSVFLLKDWRIVSHAHVGASRPELAALMDNETTPQRRRERFGPPFARFRVGQSYFVPGEIAAAMASEYPVRAGRLRGDGPDGWTPLDVAYTPIVENGGDPFSPECVMGYVALDDPASLRRPSAEDFAPVEFLARVAGRAVETMRLRIAAEGSNRYIEGRNRILEQIATGLPHIETLSALARLAESVCPGMRCSIYQADATGTRLEHRSSPSMPDLGRVAESVPIAIGVVCCGEAAATDRSVVCGDIEGHPNWGAPYGDLARQMHVRACWSTPIYSSGGRVLGTLAMYYDQPHEPTPVEIETIRMVAHAAGVAMERERAERAFELSQEQLRQAQRLDAAGRLATGVAHDYNNLLMVIEAHIGQLRGRLSDDETSLTSLREIETAAGHARNMAHGLLTFTRRMPSHKRRMELGTAVNDAVRLLERAMPARIALAAEPGDGTAWVLADATQIHQVVVNLALNARDAMPEGGSLVIGAGLENEQAILTVRDTGIGMTAEVRERAFEPFFTTKTPERGAGLGLSIVHGIVRDHGGSIEVESRRGEGTRVVVRLPIARADATAVEVKPPKHPAQSRDRGECLLVEDNAQVRAVVSSMIRGLGFAPVCVGSVAEAARAIRGEHGLALLVIDVDLPDGSGVEMLNGWREAGIESPAVLISGATIELDGALPSRSLLLRKPFDAATLDRATGAVMVRLE